MADTQTGVAYSFADVTCSIKGPFGSFTFAGESDEGITIDFDEDKNTMTKSADGTGMHSLHAWNGGQATIRLLKVSQSNYFMAKMMEAQRVSAAYWGQNIITVLDPIRGDRYVCSQCACKKFAGNTYGKEGNMLEWAFDVILITPTLGLGTALYTG